MNTPTSKFFKKNACLSALTLAGLVTLSACGDAQVGVSDDSFTTIQSEAANLGVSNIVETAVAAGSFNTLAAALQATGLDILLASSERNFTVFAPTDEAFAALGQDTINALLNDREQLQDILLYHVVPDAVVNSATAISLAGQTVAAANGDEFALSLDDGSLFINQSRVITADIGASNGVIHVIDKVLLPPVEMTPEMQFSNIIETAAAAGSFNTLVAALQATGLDATLSGEGPFTVFAPTDDAFAMLGQDTINALLADPDTLSSILLYHVIAGQAVDATTAISLAGNSVATANENDIALRLDDGNLFINDSQVIVTDILTSNGIIHVIDSVLLPPVAAAPVDTAPMDTDMPATPTGTLYEVARDAGFNTLMAAAKIAGLKDTLNNPHEVFTVFAPTDAAFAALGNDTINALVNDPDTLRDILLYHVIPGVAVDAQTALGLVGTDIHTANGNSLMINQRNDGLFVNGSRITVTDVRAVNGIIHVIDAVLLPPTH